MKLLCRTAAVAAVGISMAHCGFAGTSFAKNDVPLIVTVAPHYDELAALRGAERFPGGARLLRVDNGEAKALLPEFAASADASVSFDGAHVLFAGKKSISDRWSIWELTLADRSIRQIMHAANDLIRPLYLPDDSLVYARRTTLGFQIDAAHLDGTHIVPLTFLRSSAVPEEVLADGRILFDAGYPLGLSVERGARPEMYLLYSDGSGVESYRCDHGAARWGGRQVASGDVVFTQGRSLARFTSASATEVRIPAPPAVYAGAIAEMPNGVWLLSARRSASEQYALAEWTPGSASMRIVLSQSGESIAEPVLIAPRTLPRSHPSALHKWDYGNLLVMNARLSREGDRKALPARVQLETEDNAGQSIVLGAAPVASDGSFFVQAPGDRPIRFALLDAHGAVLRQEYGWFWIRKGEQRICVGCHTGPERAAENKVPAVLLQTTIPADLTGTHVNPTPGGR